MKRSMTCTLCARLTSTAALKTCLVFVYGVSQDNQQTKITPTTGFPHFVSLEAASSCCMASESFPWPSRTGNYEAKHKRTPTERETKPKPLNQQITLIFHVYIKNTSGKKRSTYALFALHLRIKSMLDATTARQCAYSFYNSFEFYYLIYRRDGFGSHIFSLYWMLGSNLWVTLCHSLVVHVVAFW